VSGRLARGLLLCPISLMLILDLFQVANALNLTYYPMVHRLTAETQLSILVIDPFADRCLTLISGLLSLVMLLPRRKSIPSNSLSRYPISAVFLVVSLATLGDLRLFALASVLAATALLDIVRLSDDVAPLLQTTLAIVVAIEGIALSYWVLSPLLGDSTITRVGSTVASIEAGFFYFLSTFSPLVLLLLAFSWLIAPVTGLARRIRGLSLGRSGLKITVSTRVLPSTSSSGNPPRGRSNRVIIPMLCIAMLVSAVVAAYPSLPAVNPRGIPTGTDVPHYTQELQALLLLDPANAVWRAFTVSEGGSRPAFMLLLYLLGTLSGLIASQIVVLLPILLGPLLVVSVFLMARAGGAGDTALWLAVVLAALSPTVLGSMYGGLYANWFALAVSFLSFGFLMRATAGEGLSWKYLALSTGAMGVVVLSHPWTWDWMVACLVVYLVGLRFSHSVSSQNPDWRKEATAVAFVIAGSWFIDFLRSALLGTRGGISLGYSVVGQWSGVVNLFMLQPNLSYALTILLGGTLSNCPIMMLSLLGAHRALSDRDRLGLFLVAFLVMASVWIPITNSSGQHRIMMILPLFALAAIGSDSVARVLRDGRHPELATMFLAVVFLSNATYAFRSAVSMVPSA